MNQKSRLGVNAMLFVIALVALLADQLTKRAVEATLSFGEVMEIPGLSPYLTLTHSQNTGAAFSILQDANVFIIIVAIVVGLLIVYYAPRLPAEDWVSRVGLGLQFGGAMGNLVDRLRQGWVTDFIHPQIPQIGFDWPVSNIADICIVGGAIILIVSSIIQDRRQKKLAAQSAIEDNNGGN